MKIPPVTVLFILYIILCSLKTSSAGSAFNQVNDSGNRRKVSSSVNYTKATYGISINLYRVGKAERFEDLKDIDLQIAKTLDTKVNLYKITGDIGMILLNSTNPYADRNAIPYKMLYGRSVRKTVSVGDVGGFLPSSEVKEVTKWIKQHKIEHYDGFSKMYDGLSPEVKKTLAEYGSDDKVMMFNVYIRPMVILYFTALENENSIIFVGQ